MAALRSRCGYYIFALWFLSSSSCSFFPRQISAVGKFQRVSRLVSVTVRHSSSGRQPNFSALNRGRHLYSAGPSRWALANILVLTWNHGFSRASVWANAT